MKILTQDMLILLCDRYAIYNGITHWRVSFLVRGDGQFFNRLKHGKTCTLKTAQKTVQWFSDHWPAGLAWPSDIPRLLSSVVADSPGAKNKHFAARH